MPKYLMQCRVQTCLTQTRDIELCFEGHKATFLFSQKGDDTSVGVQIEVESGTNRDAQALAASFLLPQILDKFARSICKKIVLMTALIRRLERDCCRTPR